MIRILSHYLLLLYYLAYIGSFGYRYGLVESTCSGLCAAGYYCPSVLEPQPDAAVYTIWPRKPQITATGIMNYFNQYNYII